MPDQTPRRPAPRPRGPATPEPSRPDGEQPDANVPQGWRVTPSPDGRGGGTGGGKSSSPRNRLPLLMVAILALVVVEIWIYSHAILTQRVTIPYSPTFISQLEEGNVASISSTGLALKGTLKQAIVYPNDSDKSATKEFSVQIPSFADEAQLRKLIVAKDVQWSAKNPDASGSLLMTVLIYFGPMILFIAFFFWMMRRAGAGAGGMMSFGRSRAKRFDGSDIPVTFNDVAGIDEAKADLSEIVDFLRMPTKYTKLGAKIPRGVLLSGMPGTGKTLLARAVAGEAGVPFFHMSASEFVEMIVGVGASRVRDLFAQAKQSAPAIIFVDELDAIGRSRSSAGANFGGHDEREQTLNQILTEMDGFDAHTGVIVLGATNRPEILDQALLRPGRFDRRVFVQPPDRAGREAILKVHTRSVPLAAEVNLGQIAATTPGMVGADLANLVNEAALLAAKRNHSRVGQADFTDALERIVLGAARSVMMSEDDRRRTAYHESGHAIVGMLTPGADPVRKVSIIPRGQALGVTFSSPDSDRFNMDQRHLLAQIKVMLGGRCAEEVVFGDMTTGAESDIQQLTRIARYMVGRWGMSAAIGPIAVLPAEDQGMLLPGASEVSAETQRLIDEEVRTIVERAHLEVIELLRANRAQLDSLATTLLNDETLDQDEAYAAAGIALPKSESEAGQGFAPPAPGSDAGSGPNSGDGAQTGGAGFVAPQAPGAPDPGQQPDAEPGQSGQPDAASGQPGQPDAAPGQPGQPSTDQTDPQPASPHLPHAPRFQWGNAGGGTSTPAEHPGGEQDPGTRGSNDRGSNGPGHIF